MSKISRKLGELLVENGLITEDQLAQALHIQKSDRKLLGEIIVEQGYTTKAKLDETLALQYGSRLGQILINKGLVSFEQVLEALTDQQKTDKTLGQILIDKRILEESALMQGLSAQYGLPYVTLAEYPINPDALVCIPLDALRKYEVFPVDIEGSFLVVATANPENIIAESDLRFLSGMYIKYILAARSDIMAYLQ